MEVRGGLGDGDRGLHQAVGLAEGRGPEALEEASFPGWACGHTGDGTLMCHRLSFFWGSLRHSPGVGSWWLVNRGLSRAPAGRMGDMSASPRLLQAHAAPLSSLVLLLLRFSPALCADAGQARARETPMHET